jgi:hypothetical protein
MEQEHEDAVASHPLQGGEQTRLDVGELDAMLGLDPRVVALVHLGDSGVRDHGSPRCHIDSLEQVVLRAPGPEERLEVGHGAGVYR